MDKLMIEYKNSRDAIKYEYNFIILLDTIRELLYEQGDDREKLIYKYFICGIRLEDKDRDVLNRLKGYYNELLKWDSKSIPGVVRKRRNRNNITNFYILETNSILKFGLPIFISKEQFSNVLDKDIISKDIEKSLTILKGLKERG